MPQFSIIIPVYKVEKFLSECVDSVLNQTFNDFEIILVDDGSPDSCSKICDEYAKKDLRIKVIHKPNGGLSDARNAGIKIASGEYIIFIDSDDYLVADFCLQEISQFISNTNLNLYFLPNVSDGKSDNNLNRLNKDELIPRNNLLKNIIGNKYPRIAAWTWILKRQFLLSNNLFFYKGILHEDEEWMPRVVIELKSNQNVGVFNKKFYFYRLNRDGAITQSIKDKNVKDKLFIVDTLNKNANLHRGIEKHFLFTRAAQIYTYIFTNGQTILRNNIELNKQFKSQKSILIKSSKLKHWILFIMLAMGFIK